VGSIVSIFIIPALVTLLLGVALGVRFKSPVLIPATIVTLLATSWAGIALGYGFWSVALAGFEGATALQAGYLGGATISTYCLGARRRGHRHPQ
jgi:hypothetical protein